MRLYFYGVLGDRDAGHYLYVSDGERIAAAPPRGAIPFSLAEVDGVWCQREPRPASESAALNARDPQHEGIVYVHRARGWTLASWWDRSGDSRRGSCAVFLAEGEHSADGMMRLAREQYPREIARMERRYAFTFTPEPHR